MTSNRFNSLQWRELAITRFRLECRRSAPTGLNSDLICVALRTGIHCGAYGFLGILAALGTIRQAGQTGVLSVISVLLFVISASCLRTTVRELEPGPEFRVIRQLPVDLFVLAAARLTTILLWEILATLSMIAVPAWLVGRNAGPIAGMALTCAAVVGAATVTCLVLACQVCAVGLFRYKPIRSVVTAAQAVCVVIACAFFVLWQVLPYASDDNRWLFWCYPPYWLTSYFDLAVGGFNWTGVARGILSFAGIGLAAAALTGRWSILGLQRLIELDSAVTPQRPAKAWLAAEHMLNPQTAAVLQLVRRYQQDDLAFRMGLLAWVPSVVITLAGGIFTARLFAPVGGAYFAMCVMSAPAISIPIFIYAHLCRTNAYRAAWVLATGCRAPTQLMLAGRNLVFVTIVLPYLATVALACRWIGLSAQVIAKHMIWTTLLSYLVVTFTVHRLQMVPFSRPSSGMSFREIAFGLLSWFLFGLGMAIAEAIYPSTRSWLIAVVAAAAAVCVVETILRAQPRRLEVLTDGEVHVRL
jgi:hypothetical protein